MRLGLLNNEPFTAWVIELQGSLIAAMMGFNGLHCVNLPSAVMAPLIIYLSADMFGLFLRNCTLCASHCLSKWERAILVLISCGGGWLMDHFHGIICRFYCIEFAELPAGPPYYIKVESIPHCLDSNGGAEAWASLFLWGDVCNWRVLDVGYKNGIDIRNIDLFLTRVPGFSSQTYVAQYPAWRSCVHSALRGATFTLRHL